MDFHRLWVWLHLVSLVGLTGIALFWFLMPAGLARHAPPARTRELLEACRRARWPHVGIPERLRLPLPMMGLLVTAVVAATGALAGGEVAPDLLFRAKLAAFALLALLQATLLVGVRPALLRPQLALVLLALWLSAVWVRGAPPNLATLALLLHLTAMALWLGHMFVWPLLVGPALKAVRPPETAAVLREASLWMGGLGWPALAVLIPTGLYLLAVRGIPPGALLDPATYAGPEGRALLVKLLAVLWMIGYQAVFGHRRAPRAIYTDIAAALVVLAMSVLLVRGVAG